MLSREQFFLLGTGFASECNTESHGPLKPEARFYNVKPTEIRFRCNIIIYDVNCLTFGRAYKMGICKSLWSPRF